MSKKLFTESLAKKIIIAGIIGFVLCVVYMMSVVMTLYSKVGVCSADTKCSSINWQQTSVRIAIILTFVSIMMMVVGGSIVVFLSLNKKK